MASDAQPAAQRRFSTAELQEFDGKEGRSAYLAYKGKVYDVTGSKLWRNGVHVRAHSAGEDLTNAIFAAPHDDDVMSRFQVVGILIEDERDTEYPAAPWWAQLSLDHHLHPIAVHFPTALGATAPVFGLLSLLFLANQPVFETLQWIAFANLAICALSAVPAVITGIVSWYYNYSAVMTPIYRIKWGGSIVLLVIATAALLVRFLWMDGLQPTGAAFWVYMVLLVLHAPTVTVLGHFGGKITFPS